MFAGPDQILALATAFGAAAVAALLGVLATSRRRTLSLPPTATGAADAVRARVGEAEWALRVQLASAYRMAARRGWDEIIYNHITLRVPGPNATAPHHFLINQFGLRFDEVTASNLLKIDADGALVDGGSNAAPRVNLSGFVIHGAIHQARPDLSCLWHCHCAPRPPAQRGPCCPAPCL